MAGDFVNVSGDCVPWTALDEAEQSFYASTPLAEGIVEHVCRYWSRAAEHETLFDDASLIPALPV